MNETADFNSTSSESFNDAPGEESLAAEPIPVWQVVYTVGILTVMFGVLITDRVATDCVMLTALTAFYIAGIIDIKEALSGFSNQGLLTVLVLFAVAEGLNKTGALNWYVSRLLGNPRTVSEAQLRVMLPIAVLSGFINDTPLVTIALPSVIQWARKVQISPRFLLMPLSFAALLGGVSTLIGTSTNLVIAGLLQERYKDDPEFQDLSLFGLGQYGVPVAMAGITYVLLATPYLLARGRHRMDASSPVATAFENVLLGARLTQWSPAAGRTVQRSGLRDTGGIYLVRVLRCSTGNTHHAVGPDFVLQVGDILYFTGLVETFGDFCAEHCLEVVTNEIQTKAEEVEAQGSPSSQDESNWLEVAGNMHLGLPLPVIQEEQIGYSLESLLESAAQDRWRVIYHLQDFIRGEEHAYVMPVDTRVNRIILTTIEPDQIVVAVDTMDRSGLLLDISKCLAGMEMDLHHTEATVKQQRSLSIWRCSKPSTLVTSACVDEIWPILQALLAKDSGAAAMKRRGLRVIRAIVMPQGRLAGATTEQIDFRQTYKAAIVNVLKSGTDKQSPDESVGSTFLEAGNALVLQVEDDSPLLLAPPEGFYDTMISKDVKDAPTLISKISRFVQRKDDQPPDIDDQLNTTELEDGVACDDAERKAKEAVWRDLRVVRSDNETAPRGEFLTATTVAPGSQLSGKTAAQSGIDKLPDALLVSLERPVEISSAGGGVTSYTGVAMEEPLRDGDVLWFSCSSAASVGDLRKIPGLLSYEENEVNQIETHIHDRRLVQAVVARNSFLVGKTIKEVRFRTQYGAAVIAVQREGQRVHDHPGNIKLQAGDVLLLDTGASFMSDKIHQDQAFVLVSEVKNSAPPRMRMLIPALIFTLGAYACFVAKLSTLIGCAMVAVILMVSCGILSQNEARDAIQWEIFLTIGSAFGIGLALVNTGVAGTIASWLVSFGNAVGLGKAGLLGSVYLSTVLISQVVANNAAAALIFPIAMNAAETTGTDILLMSYTIMLAASAAFMTPFGYQTNLMVMGPGGYTTVDFLIFGTPMQVVLLLATTTFLVAPMWICWLGTFVCCSLAVTFRIARDIQTGIKQKLN